MTPDQFKALFKDREIESFEIWYVPVEPYDPDEVTVTIKYKPVEPEKEK